MPPRKAGARKRKQRPDADEGVLEEKQNDQVKEDKQNDVGESLYRVVDTRKRKTLSA